MRAWLQLMRVALAPTILWDAAAGVLMSGVAWSAGLLWPVAVLLLAYHGGMILNDWADRRRDALAARARPLPAGRIAPAAALAAGLLLLGAAAVLARLRLSGDAALWALALVGIVLLYDLGGGALRRTAGPVLLAVARTVSVLLAPLHVLGAGALAREIPLEPALTYALYFLFLARLAQHEEEGLPGMRALPYVIMAAASPLVLAVASAPPWWMHAAWLAFAWWLVAPAWTARHADWPPARVQAAVRHGLGSGPLVLSLGILALPDRAAPAWALAGVATCTAVRILARRFAPE